MKSHIKKIINTSLIILLSVFLYSCSTKTGENKIESTFDYLRFINNKEFTLDSNKSITIGFKDGRLSGSSVINLYMGSYEIYLENNNLFLNINLAGSTMKAGPKDDMEKEIDYLKSIEGKHPFYIDRLNNKIEISNFKFSFSKEIKN